MKHNTMKKTIAGAMALLCVAAYMPVNAATEGLFGAASITASASESYDVFQAFEEKSVFGAGDEIFGEEFSEGEYYDTIRITVVTASGETLATRALSWTADQKYKVVGKDRRSVELSEDPAYSQYEYAQMMEFIFTVEPAAGSEPTEDQVTESGFIWGQDTIRSMHVSWRSEGFEKNGITVTSNGDDPADFYDGKMTVNGNGYIEFASSVGNINQIVIHYSGGHIDMAPGHWYNNENEETLTWNGGAETVRIAAQNLDIEVTSIEFKVGGEAALPRTYWSDAWIDENTTVDGDVSVVSSEWSWIVDNTIIVVNGNLTIDPEVYLVLSRTAKLIVNGDLTVQGTLLSRDGSTLIVNGNVYVSGEIDGYSDEFSTLIAKGAIDNESLVYKTITRYTNIGVDVTDYVPGNCFHSTYFLNNDAIYALADGKAQKSSLDDVTYAVPQHTYGQPAWTWEADNTSASAGFTCNKCGESRIVKAEVTSEITEPTYTADGKIVYVARAEFEGSEYSDSRETLISRLTLTHVDAAAATCTKEGNVEYWYDEKNQKYFSDETGAAEILQKDTIIPAAGHTYGAPTWNWSEDYTQASAAFTCEKDDSTEKVQAVVTSDEQEDKIVYTAKVTFNNQEFTDVREAELEDLIQAQPKDVTFGDKQNVTFSVEAAEGSTYQWYYRRSASAAWTRVTNNGTSASYTTRGSAARDGWQFYCEVTKDDRTESSEAATMHYETLITAQPEDITTQGRQNVTFEVASIEGCTYQWFYRRNASAAWTRVANNGASASYTTVGSADRDGWQFCCKVMKGDASVLSGVATLNYESLITAQPEDAASVGRQNVTFEVESIEGSTYQWYYRKSATSRWILVANNGTSASYTTAGLASRDGWQFCCKVMKDGASELSDVATLNYQSLVTAQPEDAAISARQNVTFEVESVEGCTYQWYYRKSADSRWIMVRNNGTSASYTTVGNADRDGWQFCCKVMQGDASELSEVATLHYQGVK